MSSCLSGGGGRAACGAFDLEIVKSPSSTSTTARAASHNTPSPSSTLSESNSPLSISTRKPRTPRKRPNQTYKEAAALLSTAYPNIFSSSCFSSKKALSNSLFFGIKPHHHNAYDEASELILPFGSIEEPGFLFHSPLQMKSDPFFEQKEVNSGEKIGGGGEVDDLDEILLDDFDAESILDGEIEEGIESIMGNVGSNDEQIHRNGDSTVFNCYGIGKLGQMMMNPWYGNPMGIGFSANLQLGFGLRSALRDIDDANWWRFPTVDFDQISPRNGNTTTTTTAAGNNNNVDVKNKSTAADNSKKKATSTAAEKKKKKKKLAAPAAATESKSSKSEKEDAELNRNGNLEQKSGLLLKLNYDNVLEAWSDKALPFSDEILGPDAAGADVHARLAQIDLFGEGEGGLREASVLRYKEKRRTRLFSKKIRYQVRKLNADQRPRLKGRFVRKPNDTSPRRQR